MLPTFKINCSAVASNKGPRRRTASVTIGRCNAATSVKSRGVTLAPDILDDAGTQASERASERASDYGLLVRQIDR